MHSGNDKLKVGWRVLKWALTVLSLWFIWVKVSSRLQEDTLKELISSTVKESGASSTLTWVFVLMLINWGLESLKWQYLLMPFIRIGFFRSFRAVMSGTTVSLFTPNRIGEFAGRVLHLDPGYRIQGVVATITGSMSQLLVTILTGCVAVLILPDDPSLSSVLPSSLLVPIALGIPLISFVVFYFLPRIPGWMPAGKVAELLSSLRQYSAQALTVATLLSAIRYFIFSLQFFLVLRLFGIELEFMNALRLIAIIYLAMAIIPTMALSEITIRGSVALYFLAPYSGDPLAILAASTLLWIVNLAFPASLGALAALLIRLKR